jgi:nicotinate-nucleotide adenylyltransferase
VANRPTSDTLTASNNSTPLVLFGGTFDPVHLAHIACAKAVSALLHSPVHLLPNAEPPHRDQPFSSSAQRLAMLSLACEGDKMLVIDDWELRQTGPSYSVDTLRHFRRVDADAATRPLILLIGADSFASLHRWHQWQAFAALCHLIVAPRPGAPRAAEEVLAAFVEADDIETLLKQPAGRRFMLNEPTLGISSSAIRHDLREKGQSSAINGKVFDYIQRQGLYNLPHQPNTDPVGRPPANTDEDS